MNRKKILVIGGAGLIGKALLQRIPPHIEVLSTSRNSLNTSINLDIAQVDSVKKVFEDVRPTIVVHTASIGNVDYCEHYKEEAYLVNVVGSQNVMQICRKNNIKLIFLSTNAVFNGKEPPYSEDSFLDPVNYYRETKAIVEKMLFDGDIDYAIARLTLSYGWNNANQRSNPFTWLLEKLKKNEKVYLVNDIYVNPILSLQAADAIWQIILLDKKGIYNIAGAQRVNRYEFGVLIAKEFGFDTNLIHEVTSDYFPNIANRMPDTTYATKKMEHELFIKPLTIEEGLRILKQKKD